MYNIGGWGAPTAHPYSEVRQGLSEYARPSLTPTIANAGEDGKA
jgi:hypothetical protein